MNTAPLRTGIQQKEAAIKKLFERIEGSADEALVQAYEKRISALQKEVNELRSRLREAEAAATSRRRRRWTWLAVKALLSDLRGLLAQETPAAAEAIRGADRADHDPPGATARQQTGSGVDRHVQARLPRLAAAEGEGEELSGSRDTGIHLRRGVGGDAGV